MRLSLDESKVTVLLATLAFFLLLLGCKKEQTKININQEAIEAAEVSDFKTVIWNVKAYHPSGKLLKVKALRDGHEYDVKAIQDSDQISILNVKAFVNDKILPVKVLVSSDVFMPVKAIDVDGSIIDIKAITEDGQILDIKGISQSGNIVNLRAIDKDGEFYKIEAISPKGWINNVKGVKLLESTVEQTINGVDVYAHIKAMPQTY